MECIFCKIAAGQIPSGKVYENDLVFAFMDINPLSEGHVLVIPKEHYERFDQCPPQVASEIAVWIGRIASAVVSGVDCDGYNVLCNNGSAAGQEVKHVHFHIIPRSYGDGIFTEWPAKNYSEDKIETIRNKISEKIQNADN